MAVEIWETNTGTLLDSTDPLPSSPFELFPQHLMVPSELIAHECLPPTSIKKSVVLVVLSVVSVAIMNPEEATSLLKDSLSASSVQDTSKTTIKMRNNFRGILDNKSKPKLIL